MWLVALIKKEIEMTLPEGVKEFHVITIPSDNYLLGKIVSQIKGLEKIAGVYFNMIGSSRMTFLKIIVSI